MLQLRHFENLGASRAEKLRTHQGFCKTCAAHLTKSAYSYSMDCQDWTPVRLPGRRATAGAGAGSRPIQTAGAAVLRRLDSEDLPLPTKSLSGASRHAIVTARVAQDLTQAQLNTQCSFPPHTIRDIESGKLCPTPTQLGVLNRVLKLVLKYE